MCTCLFGEWERGKELLDEVFAYNSQIPGWLHALVALYHYNRSEYEEALKAAVKCQIPGLHWGHIHRRTNLYDAAITIEPVDEVWKITAIELHQEQRVDPTATN